MSKEVELNELPKEVSHLRKMVEFGFMSGLGIVLVLAVNVVEGVLTTSIEKLCGSIVCVCGLCMFMTGMAVSIGHSLAIKWNRRQLSAKNKAIRLAIGAGLIVAYLAAILLALFVKMGEKDTDEHVDEQSVVTNEVNAVICVEKAGV